MIIRRNFHALNTLEKSGVSAIFYGIFRNSHSLRNYDKLYKQKRQKGLKNFVVIGIIRINSGIMYFNIDGFVQELSFFEGLF